VGRTYLDDYSVEPGSIEIFLADTSENLAGLRALLSSKMKATRYSNRGLKELWESPFPRTHEFPDLPLFRDIQEWLDFSNTYERRTISMGPHKYLQTFPQEFDHKTIIGHYGLTDKTCKIKWRTDIPWSNTEMAIGYIELCEMAADRKLTPKYNKYKDLHDKRSTIFYTGKYTGELAYIDMCHAYWQILYPTTIDMEYDPDQQEIGSQGKIPYIKPDEFAQYKDTRLVMGSLYNHRMSTYWDEEKQIVAHKIGNPTKMYRPYNLAYIYDVMNAIATDVREHFPVCQWLTDAPIVPGKCADSVREFLKEEWEIETRLEARGEGVSRGTNSYFIEAGYGLPGKKSGSYDRIRGGYAHKKMPAANVEKLKHERMDMLHGENISFVAPHIMRPWSGGPDIRKALPMPLIAVKKRGPRGPKLEIPENPIPMYEEK
jgi:hypothetical protein